MQDSVENDERVMTLVRAALRMPASERTEYLRVACKGEADLFAQVLAAVEWEERMGDFLRRPLIDFIDLEEAEAETQQPEQPFRPGHSISDRFVILREVGRGGMGIVYEAFDRKRNQRIAIKCAQPGFGRLLSPELEGALKVRHPNICLVNEIHTTQTEFGELDFLTMEFLEGETLSARLAREGKLTLNADQAEDLEIARQLCAGLAAAHANGILHRDLKAANVILNRREDGSLRAVITDFGLAGEARLDSELDGGTPAYMAPELWRGEKPSRASDVYALGVILYEMITGKQPFAVDEADRPSPSPTLPSTLNEDLDARWDKAVLPCLEAAPTARPEAGQVLAVFDKRPLWKSPAAAVAVLALAALLAGFQRPLMKLFKPADIRLAILPLESPADLQEMGNGVLQEVADRLMRSRGNRQTIIIIPPSEASQNNVQNPHDAANVFHATHAFQVKVRREASEVVAEAAVVELAYLTHLRDFSARYSAQSIGDLPGALTGAATSALHLGRVAASDTVSSAASAIYDRALYFLHRDDNSFEEAMDLFQQAAHIDPHSPLPLAGLSEAQLLKAWATKDQKWIDAARESIKAAEAINPDSVAVMLAAGHLESSTSQPEKALQRYQRVEELEPRNVEVLLRMANLYDRNNLPQPAIESFRKAITLEPGFYRPHQELGRFLYFRGEYAEAAGQFRLAITRAPGLYDPYLYLGAAETDLGDYDQGEQAFLDALKIKETARALCSLGVVKVYKQQYSEALQLYRRSVQLDPGSYVCLLNLGDVSRFLHRGEDAPAQYQKAMALAAAELKQNPRNGYTRAYVAYLAGRLGDRQRAEDEVEQALQLLPDDNKVIRRAILTYVMLGSDKQALDLVPKLTERAQHELERHPDLAAFCGDPRFKALIANNKTGGK
jgi:serine/threonine protein kinase